MGESRLEVFVVISYKMELTYYHIVNLAQEFGATEFFNPSQHTRPAQQVLSAHMIFAWLLFLLVSLCHTMSCYHNPLSFIKVLTCCDCQ